MSRYLDIAAAATAHDGDAVYTVRGGQRHFSGFAVRDGRRHFVGFPQTPEDIEDCVVSIPLSVTRRQPHARAYFNELIKQLVADGYHVSIDFTFDAWFEYSRPPNLPRWLRVALHVGRHTPEITYVFERVGDAYIWHNTPLATPLASVICAYRSEKEPRVTLTALNTCFDDGWVDVPTTIRCMHSDRARYTPLTIAPIDRDFDGRWLENAVFRWPYAHALITDAVIGLSALDLPAYVLLWILDWLSPLHLWGEKKKITLIQGLIASIRALNKR